MANRHIEWKVDKRVKHVCEALGMRRGYGMAKTDVLARRLRGLGLAWHSHRLEEYQVISRRLFHENAAQ